jgi:uncharacterized protein (TIGR00297 family)
LRIALELFIQQLFRAPSPGEWVRFGTILGGICAVIGIGEAVRLALRWPPEFTRKLVHISVAILIFFAPQLFESGVPAIILAVLFTFVAFAAIKLGLLKSLHSVSRGAYGTVYYPLAFLILVVLFWNSHPEIVSLSMLALGLGDASAAIVGESIARPTVYHLTSDKKSVQGSTAMFVTTAIGLTAGLCYFDGSAYSLESIITAVLAASLLATAWEALSSRALDNLTIPLSVAFVLSYVLVPTSAQNVGQFATGVALGVTIAVAAYYALFLNASGAVATFLLASLVYGVGGWKWTTPILTFFIVSSLLSRMGRNRKKGSESITEKGGRRDAGQVGANGGIAGFVVLLQYVFQHIDLYPVYLGAVAAVTTDTWGTEIGTYVRGKTVSIVSLRRVDPGMSGGVSLAGFIGGIFGAAIIALSASAWINVRSVAVLVIIAGVAGSAVDSFLGATVQARYRCVVCGKDTERVSHCSSSTRLEGGASWINNDVVNWMCALAGALVACGFMV